MNIFLFSDWAHHHTPQNVLETKEFVINIPSRDIVKQVMKTVEHFPRGVDEIVASSLTSIPSRIVKTPRITECKAHLECKYLWSHEVKISDDMTDIVIAGEIVAASADEDVLCGSAEEKLKAMKIPYITNRSVDGRDWKAKDPKMCGIISQIKDFWEMTH
jgi:flavin reductase (DIM6/NTAB) family NADH-FMN oxidoreductase RutF